MARQKKKSNPIVTALIFGIFGIVLIFLGVKTFIGLHGKLLNITTCDSSEVQVGKYIEADLTYGYGKYIEKTTTYNHIVTRTDGYYYLVDVCDKNPDGSERDSAKWIGVSINKSDDDLYSAISTEDNAAPIHITGVVKKNSSEVQGYLNDYIRDYVDYYYEYLGQTPTQSDYDYFYNEAFPYYIEVLTPSDYLFNLGLGALFLAIGIIYFIVAMKKKKSVDYTQTATASPMYDSYDPNYGGNMDYNNMGADTGYNNMNTSGMYTPEADSNNYSSDMAFTDQAQSDAPEPTPAQNPYSDPFYNTQADSHTGGFSLKQDE